MEEAKDSDGGRDAASVMSPREASPDLAHVIYDVPEAPARAKVRHSAVAGFWPQLDMNLID